jgi:hypothetical protein
VVVLCLGNSSSTPACNDSVILLQLESNSSPTPTQSSPSTTSTNSSINEFTEFDRFIKFSNQNQNNSINRGLSIGCTIFFFLRFLFNFNPY